jgi:hypothetical protein
MAVAGAACGAASDREWIMRKLSIFPRSALFAIPLIASAQMASAQTTGTSPGGVESGPSFSFTTSGSITGGISFAFAPPTNQYPTYSNPTNGSAANGNLYLFSSPYAGTIAGLSSASSYSSYLGQTSVANGAYTFGSNIVLNGGQTYYAYSDLPGLAGSSVYRVNLPAIGTSDPYAVGVPSNTYSSVTINYPYGYGYLNTGNIYTTGTGNGQVWTAPVVPEPATWAMMLTGFAMVGGVARYRRRRAKVTYA